MLRYLTSKVENSLLQMINPLYFSHIYNTGMQDLFLITTNPFVLQVQACASEWGGG